MDPQHALALQLAKEMFHDADPAAVKLLQTRPERVGVYIGAWQEVREAREALLDSIDLIKMYKDVKHVTLAVTPKSTWTVQLLGSVEMALG